VQIAVEEGIEADEEALHIIAQKADGAMRDALSIFDRVVSFSGKKLTRKAVTENLNVLDYDTYFLFTDLILQNDIPQALVQFNEVLSRGFDGHHFIAGLASHFRDLMVSKNPPTIHLLEVGDTTKKKYYEQSQKSEMSFLLKAIEIANTCDLSYRTSRNQRLLVVMQLASITFDGEKKNNEPFLIPPSYYKVDTSIVTNVNNTNEDNSAFAKAQQDSNTDVENNKQSPVTETTNQVSTLKAEETKQEAISQPVIISKDNSSQTSTESNPTPVSNGVPNISLRKHSVSGLSLKGLQKKKELQEKKASEKVDVSNLPSEPFTEIAMQAAWTEYVSKLINKGEKIIASNLEADQPTLNGTNIQLEYPNETMKIEVERAQGPLLEFLKRKLNNYDIALDITVNEEVQRKYAYTPQEKYEKLLEQNPALDILRKTFDLDL